MKLGQDMNVDDLKVDFKGQGHSSKVKVNRSKKIFQVSFCSVMDGVIMVKGHTSRGQRSLGSRSA